MLLQPYLITCAVLLVISTAFISGKPVSSSSSPSVQNQSTTKRHHRSATTTTVHLWPNAVVPFEIDQSLLKAKSNIRDSLNHYMQKTCIHFQPRSNETDYILFEKNADCSSSSIGRSGGQQVISLGAGCQSLGIINHEIGHALGLVHEHTRSDRDLFVIINTANIKDYHDKGIRTQFAIPENDKNLTVYDYDSIMHYGNTPFSKDNQKPTITAINDIRLLNPSQKSRLSELDVFAVNFLYSCADNKKKR